MLAPPRYISSAFTFAAYSIAVLMALVLWLSSFAPNGPESWTFALAMLIIAFLPVAFASLALALSELIRFRDRRAIVRALLAGAALAGALLFMLLH